MDQRSISIQYDQRVHRVMDYIRTHLTEDLSLARLAALADFSCYHFHRIFKSVACETLAAFTRRARLERAVYLMRGAPHRALTSIALEVGFATPSDFSRVFRATYGQSPSAWDRKARLDGRTDFEVSRAMKQELRSQLVARIVERPACRLVYVRVANPWVGNALTLGYAELIGWFAEHGIATTGSQLIGLSWDSELATPLERLRYDLGLTVGPQVAPDDRVGVHEFPAVRAVELHCTCLHDTALAWDYLYAHWLPSSGYEPAELPAMKRFRYVPATFDAAAWNVDCSIALRPRSGAR